MNLNEYLSIVVAIFLNWFHWCVYDCIG